VEILQHRDYRTFLKEELERRAERNTGYSLRAFARDLAISPQMLSLVLNGKKSISQDIAASMANRLGFDPKEAGHFLDLAMLSQSRSSHVRAVLEFRIRERVASADSRFKTLDVEAFKAIADWHHFAILALTEVEDFKSDAKWIADRLGVSTFEISQALERLKKLELLEQEGNGGRLRRTSLNMTATYGSPNAALRKLATQLLEKAVEALEAQSIEERDVTHITMAIDPALLPEAKKMIAEFRRKFCEFFNQGEKTEVYTFVPALYRLTKKKGAKK
jgi:uncharacterized protein (TIGR02147 family)